MIECDIAIEDGVLFIVASGSSMGAKAHVVRSMPLLVIEKHDLNIAINNMYHEIADELRETEHKAVCMQAEQMTGELRLKIKKTLGIEVQ